MHLLTLAAHQSLGWPRGQLSLTWRSFYPPTLTVVFGGLQHGSAGSHSPPPSTAALGLLPPISLFIIDNQQQQGSISFLDQFPRGPKYWWVSLEVWLRVWDRIDGRRRSQLPLLAATQGQPGPSIFFLRQFFSPATEGQPGQPSMLKQGPVLTEAKTRRPEQFHY